MRIFAWIIAALAAIGFALSFMLDTRLAPLVGVVLLSLAIAYATWTTRKAGTANYRRAERATRQNRLERERKARIHSSQEERMKQRET